jgi:HEAT repeat protein
MKASIPLIVAINIGCFSANIKSTGIDDIPHWQDIRDSLREEVDYFRNKQHPLVSLGEKAFPAYVKILEAKDAEPGDICSVFEILVQVKGDRSRFLEYAVNGLADKQFLTRLAAVELLGQIGSEKDAAPVVALLSDERREASFAAAKTLAAIGDRRTVVAFDVWLRSGNHWQDRELLQHVTKRRDELKARLEKVGSGKK